MTTEESDRRDSDPLAAFLEAARAEAPQLSPGLRARIIGQAGPAPAPEAAGPGRLRGWLSGWVLSGLAGGVTAGLAGLWVGFVLPMPVAALDAPLWMQDALSYVDMITMPLIGLDDPLLMGM
ncbi:hypothetical protein [Natronohydrobacter thiooxidans]|uniref:hypothetical protein n=1 Tax=Natronohydrobacter thiooxidans TaxID=87172 RepID=UPI0008FF177B|nr:hypothetical protein [Natronohydrobacter thiooxidans]